MALAPAPRVTFFTSTKLPTCTSAPRSAPGRRRANGPTRASCADARALEVAVGLDLGAVLDRDARAEEHVGLDDDVAADLGVVGQPDRLRRNQRGALVHDARAARASARCASAAASWSRELTPSTSSSLAGDDAGAHAARCARSRPRRSDSIRPSRWHCRCGRARRARSSMRKAMTPELHSRMWRSSSLASLSSRMARSPAAGLGQQPAVAGRICGLEAEHGDRRHRRRDGATAAAACARRSSGVSA